MRPTLPIVALIGRANTGKSSLFNRLVGQRQAIVADLPGTTRDNVFAKLTIADKGSCWLVDTAGKKRPDGELETSIQNQLEESIAAADILVLVADAKTGPTIEDRRLAQHCLKTRRPLILAINKSDATRTSPDDFRCLAINDLVTVSAIHGQGIEHLVKAIAVHLPRVSTLPVNGTISVAILGRPNVGKSQLFNHLSNSHRALVSTIAGTTRDVNRVEIAHHHRPYELMDTAGVRRSGKSARGIEFFSAIRTQAAIEECDVAMLLVDSTEPATKLDQKIASSVAKAGKGLIVLINKWDLIDPDQKIRQALIAKIGYEFQFVGWAPMLPISALKGKNTDHIWELLDDIIAIRSKRWLTPQLNNWLQLIAAQHPPSAAKGPVPKLRYISQVGSDPPAFKIFGSHLKGLPTNYRRYLDRQFRLAFAVTGTALHWQFIDNRI